MTSPSFRQVRRAIYALKRATGQSVTLCRTTGDSVDVETGKQTESMVQLVVKRAVLVTAKSIRAFAYDLAFIAANKNFTYGGFFDHKTRTMLVDRRDVPTSFPLDLNMHVLFNGRRWEVKAVEEYEEAEVVVLLLDSTDGVLPLNDYDGTLATDATVTDGLTGTGP